MSDKTAEPRILCVSTGYFDTSYLEWGAGDRLICLTHGFPETPYIWAEIAEALSEKGYRVVAPFLPGYGVNNGMTDRSYTPKELGDWLNTFIRTVAVPETKSIDLIGHDFGAVAGYFAIADSSTLIKSFVACSIPPMGCYLKTIVTQPFTSWKRWYILLFNLRLGIAERLLSKNNFKRLKRICSTWCEAAEASSELFSQTSTYQNLGSLEGPLALYRGIFPSFKKLKPWIATYRIAFAKLSVPTKILVGADETTYPPYVTNGFSKQFTRATEASVHILPRCGHFIPIDAPDRVVKEALDLFYRTRS